MHFPPQDAVALARSTLNTTARAIGTQYELISEVMKIMREIWIRDFFWLYREWPIGKNQIVDNAYHKAWVHPDIDCFYDLEVHSQLRGYDMI